MKHDFREILPAADDPRVRGIRERDACQHADQRLSSPAVRAFFDACLARQREPFYGVTSDGTRIPDLYPLQQEDAPLERMVGAARRVLEVAAADERQAMRREIDSAQWRGWTNPEIYVSRHGVRLEALQPALRNAILDLLAASMSPRGYAVARDCMRMNHFLGELVRAPRVMNEWSYNFLLYGEPSSTEPWGWNLYGHHLCLNCFVLGGQLVLSPTFMGAEPNRIDEGPQQGLALFLDEERRGLELMRSLPGPIQERAWLFKLMNDPAMPRGRFHPADQRHLGGMFQDNRVIPYEGVRASEFAPSERARLLALIETHLDCLPAGPLAARMRAIETQLNDTYFGWIGGFGEDDPFYYKIQSPVVLIEFDHHSGVFLTNREPWKCHIHTLVRTPNGNDYGKDLLRQHYEQAHPGHLPGGRAASK